MGRLIVFKVTGIGVLSRDRRVLRGHGRPARIDFGGPSRRTFGPRLRAGRPRSQDTSFPDDPAPIASPLGPGATARRD